MNATALHVFKYDRPMDPRPAMEKLEAIAERFEDQVDITNEGGPNDAMEAVRLSEEVAGGIERAIYGMRALHNSLGELLNHSACGDYAKKAQQTVRHALAALGERP